MNEIKTLSKKISHNNFTCIILRKKNLPKRFISFKAPLSLLKNLKEFKLDLNEMTRGKPKHKSEQQKSAIGNIKKVYQGLEKVIKLY